MASREMSGILKTFCTASGSSYLDPRRDVEDYLKVVDTVGSGVGRFMKRFVITRWIEVGPVVERVIDQWSILSEYFLV
jgi:hypothetical protein